MSPEPRLWSDLRRRERFAIVIACILVGLPIPFYAVGWVLSHV